MSNNPRTITKWLLEPLRQYVVAAKNVFKKYLQGGTAATGQGMGYIAIPGSPVDLYSGSILSNQNGITQTISDGTILGNKLKLSFN
jgi:hypothetical protein